jgi:hypothetical protein
VMVKISGPSFHETVEPTERINPPSNSTLEVLGELHFGRSKQYDKLLEPAGWAIVKYRENWWENLYSRSRIFMNSEEVRATTKLLEDHCGFPVLQDTIIGPIPTIESRSLGLDTMPHGVCEVSSSTGRVI